MSPGLSSIVAILVFTNVAFTSASAQPIPHSFVIEGRLYNQTDGSPLSDTNTTVMLEVVTESAPTCVLYRETHANIDFSNATDPTATGVFALELGTGVAAPLAKPSFVTLFSAGTFTGVGGCSVTANPGEHRYVRIGISNALNSYTYEYFPLAMITSVPTAVVAQNASTLQGYGTSAFIMSNTDVSQSHLDNIFSTTNYSKLTNLLNGTSTTYMPSAPTAAVDFNSQRLINVATPATGAAGLNNAVNRTYADSTVAGQAVNPALATLVGPGTGAGSVMSWDAAANRWTASLPVDATKLPLAGGTMTGAIDMGNSALKLGRVNNAQESVLVATLPIGTPGASWYNTDTGTYKIWNGTVAVEQANLVSGKLNASWIPNTTVTAGTYGSSTLIPVVTVGADGRVTAAYGTSFTGGGASGSAGGDLTGTYPNPTLAANSVTTSKINDNAITAAKIKSAGVAINRLVATDPVTPNTLTYFECSINNQIMMWTASGWACTTVSALAPVKTVAGKTPDAFGDVPLNIFDISGADSAATKKYGTAAGELVELDGSARIPASLLPVGIGTITQVTAVAPLMGGGTSGSVTIAIDTGTAANQVVRLNGSAQLPDVDGSLLTNVNAAKIGTRKVATTAPSPSQVLAWNGSQWEPTAASGGSVASVTSGTGLVPGVITANGTINIDVGSTSGKIVQVDGTGKLDPIDGSRLFNLNASNIGTRIVSSSAPVLSQVLGWNGSQWEPMSTATGSVTNITAGAGLVPSTITSSGTISVDTGITANKIVQFDSSARYPGNDGSAITNVNAVKLQTFPISSGSPGVNQVLTWNGSLWMGSNAATGTVVAVAAGTGLVSGTISSNGTLNIDVGSTANKIVQVNGVGQLDPIDGSQLFNLNASKLGTRPVANIVPSASQVLGWSGSQWEPVNAATGTMTSIAAGAGLVPGTITGAGTIAVDTGLTPNKIVQFDSSARYPGNDGSAITNINAMKLQTNPVASGTPSVNQVLTWNGSLWMGANTATGTVVAVAAGTGLVSGTISSNGTLNIDVGSTANKIVQVNGSGQLDPIDGSLLFNLNASNLGTRKVSAVSPTPNQVLTWNGSQWEPNTPSGITWPLTSGLSSAGAPSYSFASDLDTGFYSTAPDNIALATNGVARITVLANGNVGIGKTSPGSPFEVWSTFTSSGTYKLSNSEAYVSPGGAFSGTVTANRGYSEYTSPTSSPGGTLKGMSGETGMSASGIIGTAIGVAGSVDAGNGTITNASAGSFTVSNSSGVITNAYGVRIGTVQGTNKWSLYASDAGAPSYFAGSVGIGTTSPGSAALDIVGTGSNNSALLIPRNTTALRPPGANGMIRYNTNTNKFEFFENAAWVNYNAGAGVPSFPLLASPGITAPTTPSYSFTGDPDTGFFSPGVGTAAFATNGTTRMTIDLAGKVGIGTTNPTETVDISKNQNNPTSLRIANGASNAAAMANITLSTDNGDIGYLYAPSSAYPDAYLANHLNLESSSNADGLNLGAGGSGGIRFWTVSPSLGNERMYLANDGKLGIGTSLPGSAALEIVGTGANNSAILIPRNTTALRPAGANGMLRYNTNLAKFEFFESGAWKTYQTPGGAGAFYGTSSSLIPTGGLTSFWDVSGVQDHTSPTDKQMWHNYQLNSINRTTASLTNGTYTGTFSVKGEHHVAAGATNPGGHAGSSVEAYRNDTSSATPDYGTMQALIGSRIIVGHGTAPSGNPYTKELTGLEIEGTIGSGSVDYYKALRINGWSGTNPSSGSFGIYQESFNMANFFAGTVGIGTDQPRAALDVQGWGSTSAIIVPRDSGFSRPSPVEGMIRYNTTSNTFEGYSGGAWKDFTTATDAASTYLALNGGAVTGNTSFDQMVSIGGILAMVNGTNINMNGGSVLNAGTITGNSALTVQAGGTNQNLTLQASGSGWVTVSNGSGLRVQVTTDSTSPTTGATTISGGLGVAKSMFVGGNLTAGTVTAGTSTFSPAYYGTGTYSTGVLVVDSNSSATKGTITIAPAGGTVRLADSGTAAFIIGQYGTTTTLIAPNGSGKVGIGTLTPGNAILSLYNTASTQLLDLYGSSTSAIGANQAKSTFLIRQPSVLTGQYSGYDSTVDIWAASNSPTVVANGLSGTVKVSGTTSSSGHANGVMGSAQVNVSSGVQDLAGVYGSAGNLIAGSAQNMVGVRGDVSMTASYGTTAALRGYMTSATGAGATTAAVGLFEATGDFSNAPVLYGVLIGDMPAVNAGGSGSFGIYQVGVNDKNYFGGKVGIGTTQPGSAALEVYGTGVNHSAILIPRDITANRPAGVNGMLRYNSNTNKFEGFENGAWKDVIATQPRSTISQFEEFMSVAYAGTGSTAAVGTALFTASTGISLTPVTPTSGLEPGIARMSAAPTAGNAAISMCGVISTPGTIAPNVLLTNSPWVFEARVRFFGFSTAISSSQVRIGMVSASNQYTESMLNGVFFQNSTGTLTHTAMAANATTAAAGGSSAITNNTWYTYKIVWDGSAFTYFINGGTITTPSGSLPGVGTASMCPGVFIVGTSTPSAARNVDVDYISFTHQVPGR